MIAPALVYTFCFITCALCAVLLLRSWLKTRTRLLAWIAAAFGFLAVNNFFLLADTTIFPDVDLSIWRVGSAIAGVSTLILGLIWEAE